MAIQFKYPVVTFEPDYPEDTEITYYVGEIRPICLDKEPYEVTLDVHGYSFHLIFGSQINGNFLCIPNWQFGCELADYSERSWNMNSMLDKYSQIDYEDATAIVWGLSLIKDYIMESHAGADAPAILLQFIIATGISVVGSVTSDEDCSLHRT